MQVDLVGLPFSLLASPGSLCNFSSDQSMFFFFVCQERQQMSSGCLISSFPTRCLGSDRIRKEILLALTAGQPGSLL